jgi:hypothetical protein
LSSRSGPCKHSDPWKPFFKQDAVVGWFCKKCLIDKDQWEDFLNYLKEKGYSKD